MPFRPPAACPQRSWRERLSTARASALLLRLADALVESPILTIPAARGLLGVTYPAARLNVQKLVDVGILRPVGPQAYGRTFIAREVLDIVEDK